MIASQRRWIAAVASAGLMLAGCDGCGARTDLVDDDAGLSRDSSTDAQLEDASAALCGPEDADVACVPGGAFELAKYWWDGVQQLPGELEPSPIAEVVLPTFWIDRTEVTNRAYAMAVEGGSFSAPPESCGVRAVLGIDPDDGTIRSTPELSGWTGGAPEDARLDHPVVCVTRAEAQAFCEARGGRLPRASELMKAARGVTPGPRRFPWGNTPPEPSAERALIYAGEPAEWWLTYAIVGLWAGDPAAELATRRVDSTLDGASPYGVMGLSGNVSEHVFDCAGDIDAVYRGLSTERLVHPTSEWREVCAPLGRSEVHLIAGSHWGSAATVEALSMGIATRVPLPATIGRAGYRTYRTPNGPVRLRFDEVFWQGEMPEDFSSIPSEEERRSWFVGFRCAYDAPPT